ncbi:MAG: hypothetical protein L0G94_04120 [Brachybacterium sp.]|uniref:hypothetical protein n=1 Tax=Brachybacterium sp. TaxID=1891286 RepID=UPI002648320F|nr:hypothetical protein [Brachybacterium sp.]MDN5685856.1 hypothetical protein [Brachybacterium sp.]
MNAEGERKMSWEQQQRDIAAHGEEVRSIAARLTPERRADLLLEVTQGIYNAVKIDSPEGGGLDGRDGPERMGLAAVVDAAQDHHHAVYTRGLAARDAEENGRAH